MKWNWLFSLGSIGWNLHQKSKKSKADEPTTSLTATGLTSAFLGAVCTKFKVLIVQTLQSSQVLGFSVLNAELASAPGETTPHRLHRKNKGLGNMWLTWASPTDDLKLAPAWKQPCDDGRSVLHDFTYWRFGKTGSGCHKELWSLSSTCLKFNSTRTI